MLRATGHDPDCLIHMRIRKLNLRSSFFSLLGYGAPLRGGASANDLEGLRDAMLTALGDAGCIRHPLLARRLRFARDTEGLWYVRSELMGALSDLHGESVARKEIDRLSLLFCGALPASMTAHLQRRVDSH